MICASNWVRWQVLMALTLLLGPAAMANPGLAQVPDSMMAASQPVLDEDGLRAWARGYLQGLETSAGPPEESWNHDREVMRALYFLSVEDRESLKEARDSLEALGQRYDADERALPTLAAYEGALEVVRAKHARWPPNKLKHLGMGSEILDSLVEEHPESLEIRYLRFASYAFLPFFLRKDSEWEADTGFLADALCEGLPAFPPRVWRAVVESVLDAGELSISQRSQLTEALARAATKE